MEQNIVIAIDHSAEAEQAVKCELPSVCVKVALANGAEETVSGHFSPWSLRSSVTSVLRPICTSTSVLGHFGRWSIWS